MVGGGDWVLPIARGVRMDNWATRRFLNIHLNSPSSMQKTKSKQYPRLPCNSGSKRDLDSTHHLYSQEALIWNWVIWKEARYRICFADCGKADIFLSRPLQWQLPGYSWDGWFCSQSCCDSVLIKADTAAPLIVCHMVLGVVPGSLAYSLFGPQWFWKPPKIL